MRAATPLSSCWFLGWTIHVLFYPTCFINHVLISQKTPEQRIYRIWIFLVGVDNLLIPYFELVTSSWKCNIPNSRDTYQLTRSEPIYVQYIRSFTIRKQYNNFTKVFKRLKRYIEEHLFTPQAYSSSIPFITLPHYTTLPTSPFLPIHVQYPNKSNYF